MQTIKVWLLLLLFEWIRFKPVVSLFHLLNTTLKTGQRNFAAAALSGLSFPRTAVQSWRMIRTIPHINHVSFVVFEFLLQFCTRCRYFKILSVHLIFIVIRRFIDTWQSQIIRRGCCWWRNGNGNKDIGISGWSDSRRDRNRATWETTLGQFSPSVAMNGGACRMCGQWWRWRRMRYWWSRWRSRRIGFAMASGRGLTTKKRFELHHSNLN